MGREKPTDSGKVINILERCAPKSSKREKWAHKPQVPAHSQSHMDKRNQAELFSVFFFREPGDQKVFPLLSAFDFPGKPPRDAASAAPGLAGLGVLVLRRDFRAFHRSNFAAVA